ncbi:hypothetical protein D0T84_10215 [Dysgonomonas sp. 521]|uniref:FISUMP domain-containing protein n=1 Tax=Dysgonomonas sp. 521 TaxID=2302932 RepID=UPI0013D78E37|nr:FISUMP domain-containing protein [Dysgonomonas sp. 521]NDV95293.1 hypothetical protein [Dysgonomonas sp. 521]
MKSTCTKPSKRRLWPMLLFFMLLTSPLIRAQVTIGDITEPEEFSALELISNKDKGLRLPHLSSLKRADLEGSDAFIRRKTDEAKGLTIFNTTTNCVETWNGAQWISMCGTPVVDAAATVTSCIDYMFTYQTMNLNAGHATETPSSYQWVVDGQTITGATAATYNYTPPANIALEEDDLGNFKKTVKITCQMIVDGRTVQAVGYDVLVVKATKGTLSPIYVWGHKNGVVEAPSVKMAFAHVNLGAENDTDPCNCLGDLYQWGRKRDGNGIITGHFRRNLTDTDVWPNGTATTIYTIAQATELDAAGQVLSSVTNKYGKFIKSLSASPANYDWRNSRKNDLWGNGLHAYNPTWTHSANNPCPTGWKVPSQKQWSAIYQGGTNFGKPSSSTSSTWTAQGGFKTGSTSGYKVADALYLPAAGYRSSGTGSLSLVGNKGYYWSSTRSSDYTNYSFNLIFTSSLVGPGSDTWRAYGCSVRCVADN